MYRQLAVLSLSLSLYTHSYHSNYMYTDKYIDGLTERPLHKYVVTNGVRSSVYI